MRCHMAGGCYSAPKVIALSGTTGFLGRTGKAKSSLEKRDEVDFEAANHSHFNPNFNLDYIHIWHVLACRRTRLGPHADHSSQKKREDEPICFQRSPQDLAGDERIFFIPKPEDATLRWRLSLEREAKGLWRGMALLPRGVAESMKTRR